MCVSQNLRRFSTRHFNKASLRCFTNARRIYLRRPAGVEHALSPKEKHSGHRIPQRLSLEAIFISEGTPKRRSAREPKTNGAVREWHAKDSAAVSRISLDPAISTPDSMKNPSKRCYDAPTLETSDPAARARQYALVTLIRYIFLPCVFFFSFFLFKHATFIFFNNDNPDIENLSNFLNEQWQNLRNMLPSHIQITTRFQRWRIFRYARKFRRHSTCTLENYTPPWYTIFALPPDLV